MMPVSLMFKVRTRYGYAFQKINLVYK